MVADYTAHVGDGRRSMTVAWAVSAPVAESGSENDEPPSLHLAFAGRDATTSSQRGEGSGAERRRRVLVAEDDTDLRESLKSILETEHYEVVEAVDGEQAVAMLQRLAVDVLLLDLHMPGRDGVTVLRQTEVPPPIVIVHSAFEYYNPDEVSSMVGAKIFRALRKPVPPPELIAAVHQAVAELESRND